MKVESKDDGVCSGGACALINWRDGVDTKDLPNLGQLEDPEKAMGDFLAFLFNILSTWSWFVS